MGEPIKGLGGWKGPPVEGTVELGYAVAPGRRGRGIASAAVRGLLHRGRRAGLRLAVAPTLPETSASASVLARGGFVRTGDVRDEETGSLWRWEVVLSPIYHLAVRDEWEASVTEGSYGRSTLGVSLEEQGFIHCSFDDQVQDIADLIYRNRHDVVLLTIDPSRLQSAIRVESVARGGRRFPHVYGPLPVSAVVDIHPIPLGDDGRLRVPALPVRSGP